MHPAKRQSRLTLAKVLFSLIGTILLWTLVTNAWGYTSLFFGAESGSFVNFFYDQACRIVWALFAIGLLLRFAHAVPVSLKKLFTNRPDIKPFVIAVALLFIYILGTMIYNHGGFWINPAFDFWRHFPMFIIVAFAEELVYRGWGQNALSAFFSDRWANLIANLFFVLLHLPAYLIAFYLRGTFPAGQIAAQFVMVFILGYIFGYLYSKGHSLWSPVALHFLADFLSVLLIA